MTNIELALTNLGEASSVELHNNNDSLGLDELKSDIYEAGEVIKSARETLESKLNRSVITNQNYIDLTKKEVHNIENK